MRREWSYVALLAALSIAPVLAFNFGQATRNVTSDVVAQTSAYVSTETLTVRLCATNQWEADALRVTHRYSADTSIDVAAAKTAGPNRFVLTNAAGTIDETATHTVRVKDDDALHGLGSFSVTIDTDSTVKKAAENIGFMSVERTVTVQVVALC